MDTPRQSPRATRRLQSAGFATNPERRQTPRIVLPALCLLLATVGCKHVPAQQDTPGDKGAGVTDIAIGANAIQTGVKHLGMNLGGQNYYDSGQMLRDLSFNNPGFEGETWQSILRCKTLTATSCTDGNEWTQWPADFLKGAQFEAISGSARGVTGTVLASEPANSQIKDKGVTIDFAALSKPIAAGDFLLVKKSIPGNAQDGWWTSASGGATFSTEFTDLAPNSPGKQALRVSAAGAGQWASVNSYFDSTAGHSFLQLKGSYHLAFRAKGVAGNKQLQLSVRRQVPNGSDVFFTKEVHLSDKWQDYKFDFSASEDGSQIGTIALSFSLSGAEMLLDDATLTEGSKSAENPTAFRDVVVATLKQLHPGILRYHDGDHLGSSFDNMIAPPFARLRAGFTQQFALQGAVPLGLHEFLQLCQVIGAEPWFNMPAGMSPEESRNLIEYLSGPASTPYGAKRVALGQAAPWTTVFPVIHLELGNEEWNTITFPGASMPDAAAYGQRAKEVFLAARSSPYYQPAKIDLVIGSFVLIPDWTKQELAHSGGYDSVAVAAYLYGRLDDDSSTEALFGPMFAAPEMIDTRPTSYLVQQAKVAKAANPPAALSIYELNIGADSGSIPQASVDKTVPSVAAGLMVADHMLMMIRDLGIKNESLWELPGYGNHFRNSKGTQNETTPIFGTVVDMGGPTNLRRPQFLAEQLANTAILPTMLPTTLSGANPTWNQPLSKNDDVQLPHAHFLQTFAFTDGARHSLIVFNLSRANPLPVTFSGSSAPSGTVEISRLTANNITDSNETTSKVAVVSSTVSSFTPQTPYSLPPFSMTVFQWTKSQ
jgi:alpha-L-arabinofuranosidase